MIQDPNTTQTQIDPICSIDGCLKSVYLNEEKCIFHCQKTAENGWFSVISGESEIRWNREKVQNFWRSIRLEKTSRNDNNFSGYIFPSSEDIFLDPPDGYVITEEVNGQNRQRYVLKAGKSLDFWKADDKDLRLGFVGDINFSRTEFLGKVNLNRLNFAGRTMFSYALFEKKANFSNSVFFDKTFFRDVRFLGEANFSGTLFFGEANFSQANFEENGRFSSSCFKGTAKFVTTNFKKKAGFVKTVFGGIANFSDSCIYDEAIFVKSQFKEKANFRNTKFEGKANFVEVVCDKNIYFDLAIIKKEAIFSHAIFNNEANFSRINFNSNTDFSETRFNGSVVFSYSQFGGNVYFVSVKFKRKVSYFQSLFELVADFSFSIFSGETNFLGDFKAITYFNGTQFKKKTHFQCNFGADVFFGDTSFTEGVTFSASKFSSSVHFRKVFFPITAKLFNFAHVQFFDKSNVLFEDINFPSAEHYSVNSPTNFQDILFPPLSIFRNCDLSGASFLDTNIASVQFSGCVFSRIGVRQVLWDEKDLKTSFDVPLETYKKIETMYRQFKKNFDDMADYQTADEFYAGEMCMRRKALKAAGGNWDKRFFLWLYEKISHYNSDPMKALYWIIAIILVFFAMFFISQNSDYLSYLYGYFSKTQTMCKISLRYEPDYWTPFHYSLTGGIPILKFPDEIRNVPWFTALIHYSEVIFSAIVWTLFVFSIRRKFKR